jgi:hypothetical protein
MNIPQECPDDVFASRGDGAVAIDGRLSKPTQREHAMVAHTYPSRVRSGSGQGMKTSAMAEQRQPL